jgi:hypothetical protein
VALRKFLNTTGAATFLGTTVETLNRWRRAGKGPPFCKLHDGRNRYHYAVDDLEEWARERELTPRFPHARTTRVAYKREARDLTDEEFALVRDLFPRPTDAIRNRRFLDAVLYMARFNVPLSQVPAEYGVKPSASRTLAAWGRSGVLDAVFGALSGAEGFPYALVRRVSVVGLKSGAGGAVHGNHYLDVWQEVAGASAVRRRPVRRRYQVEGAV